MMNMMTAMDGMTMADTMTTGTAGTTMLPDIGDITSGMNVAPPAILTSIVARAQGGPVAFLKERAALLNQRASEAAAVARGVPSTARCFSNMLLASHLMGRSLSN